MLYNNISLLTEVYMKNFVVALIACSVALSSVSFACSGHKHHHKHSTKAVTQQPKK